MRLSTFVRFAAGSCERLCDYRATMRTPPGGLATFGGAFFDYGATMTGGAATMIFRKALSTMRLYGGRASAATRCRRAQTGAGRTKAGTAGTDSAIARNAHRREAVPAAGHWKRAGASATAAAVRKCTRLGEFSRVLLFCVLSVKNFRRGE